MLVPCRPHMMHVLVYVGPIWGILCYVEAKETAQSPYQTRPVCDTDFGRCIWRYIGFMLGCVGTILARWPWLVGVYIVARRPGTHNTMMLFMLTPMLGSYGWAHVGPIWRNDGPKKRPNVRIKQDLLLIRTLADKIRPLLGLCCAHTDPFSPLHEILAIFKNHGKTQYSRAKKGSPSRPNSHMTLYWASHAMSGPC